MAKHINPGLFTPSIFEDKPARAELLTRRADGKFQDTAGNEYDDLGQLTREAKSEACLAVERRFPGLSATDERFEFELRQENLRREKIKRKLKKD